MHPSRLPEDAYRTIVQLADEGRDCAVAVVLQTDGSSPCKAGSKAIIDATGVICGTIGGGLVEATAQRRAAEVLKSKRPAVLDFCLESPIVDDTDPICGGTVRVLLNPLSAEHREAYSTATAMQEHRQRGVLLTIVRGCEERTVDVQCLTEQAITPGFVFPDADAIRAILAREEPRLFVSEPNPDAQRLEVLVEPLIPAPVVVIVGGGHVGQAVAVQASLVGFDIVVVDDRPEFTRPELYPDGATMRCGEIGTEVACLPLGEDTYVAIATRGHQHDSVALAACIHAPVAYVGMIGSRRKVAMIRRDFIESGKATAEEFDRVYAPIGLDIGSATVPEIATSIAAQLIAVRRKGRAPRILSE